MQPPPPTYDPRLDRGDGRAGRIEVCFMFVCTFLSFFAYTHTHLPTHPPGTGPTATLSVCGLWYQMPALAGRRMVPKRLQCIRNKGTAGPSRDRARGQEVPRHARVE